MAETTSIEWTDATWNPITGCSVVSPGCTNCYAMGLAGTRLKHHPSRAGLTTDSKAGPVWNGKVRLNEAWLTQPLQWKRPRRIFVCAHGDLFAEGVPDAWIDRVFAVMALAPQHTFQVLTKRAARMRAYMAGCEMPPDDLPLSKQWVTQWHRRDGVAAAMGEIGKAFPVRLGKVRRLPLPNVWLGVSAEDQRRADERVPDLLATPAAVRFVSAEPLLGRIDFTAIQRPTPLGSLSALPTGEEEWKRACLDWIIVGGESGLNARPMHPTWPTGIRDQCEAAGAPFFFKQWGEWIDAETYPSEIVEDFDVRGLHDQGCIRVGKKAAGRLLDGVEHNGMPSLLPNRKPR